MNRKVAIAIIIAIICTLVAACGFFAIRPVIEKVKNHNQEEVMSEGVNQADVATISYDGKKYRAKEDLETVLFIGLDAETDGPNDSEAEEEVTADSSYNNQVQSDFVTLILLDHKAQRVDILQLNRDTICDIPILDTRGETAGTEKAQLALAHTYGSGGRDSCVNVRKTVSDFLFGQKINHFFRISTKSISTLNDFVGGVTLTLEDDFTFYDKSMQMGKTLTLQGKQAEVFVRSRKHMAEPTNLARMKRQKVYMEKWLEQARKSLADSDENLVADCVKEISGDLVSDMSVYELADVIDCAQKYELGSIVSPQGKAEKSDDYMSFYVDEEALMKMVVEMFYVEQH